LGLAVDSRASLWVLESGTGGVALVDQATGQRETVATLPGFTRGLSIVGPYAFVGLAKTRATSAMDGVPARQQQQLGPQHQRASSAQYVRTRGLFARSLIPMSWAPLTFQPAVSLVAAALHGNIAGGAFSRGAKMLQ
jgi:hypothetical protein